MIHLTTQKSIRQARNLDFCYFCGEQFEPTGPRSNHPDHVPPQSIFAKESRDFPLKVACHQQCNGNRSQADQIIGQLFVHKHGRVPSNPNNLLLNLSIATPLDGGAEIGVLRGTDLDAEMWRWVRAFHAALYGEYLPAEALRDIDIPFTRLEHTGDLYTTVPPSRLFHRRSWAIDTHLHANRVDIIRCNKREVEYACFWTQQHADQCDCVFALKIRGCKKRADIGLGQRVCVGQYAMRKSAPPANCAKEIRFLIAHRMLDPNDPFAE